MEKWATTNKTYEGSKSQGVEFGFACGHILNDLRKINCTRIKNY
jgi:hypothetical protein